MDEALAGHLAGVGLFADLDADHLRSLAALVEEFEAGEGHVLVQPGMVGAGLFLIETGVVTLAVQDREIELGPGEIVGELALLDERAVHTSRVRCKTPVKGYCISRDDFAKLLDDEPRIALPMLRVLASRLVDLVTHH